jgi:transcription initiation factor IIE alpha subunit
MTEQHVSTGSIPNRERYKVWANQALFVELGKPIRTNRQPVSVMVTVVTTIGANGTVQFTQAAVAQQCKIALQEVAKAIANLESAGLIGSVDASTERGGSLAYVVSPNFARAEKPEEASSLSVAEVA